MGAQPASAADGAPTGLTTAGRPCATETPGPYLRQEIVGREAGTGSDGGEAEFEQWDIARPDDRERKLTDVVGAHAYSQVESHTNGVTYAWRVRVARGGATSAWSDTCFYTIDRTAGEPPVITSPEYLPAEGYQVGGIGVPGHFTVTPASDDIERYRYRFGSDGEWTTVDAATLGAPITFTWTPVVGGYHGLTVEAIDRAGNAARAYADFNVRETRPLIYSGDYPEDAIQARELNFNVGVPGEFRFDSYVDDGTAIEWWIDQGGPSGRAPLAGKGSTRVMIAPTRAGQQTMYARSVTADGTEHAPRAYTFIVDNGPALSGSSGSVVLGTPVAYRLTPRSEQVVAYEYTLADRSDRPVRTGTLPAGADGAATLAWNPTVADDVIGELTVRSRHADGTLSTARWLGVTVDLAAPDVAHKGGNGIGDEYTFTASTTMKQVVDYVVTFDDNPATERVVPAAADGTATFRHASDSAGDHTLTIYARNAHGRTGDGGDRWTVTDAPRVSSAEFPGTRDSRMIPGTFTFQPRRPGTVRYEYSINDAPYQSLAAGADGSATTPVWTPVRAGRNSIIARGYTAAGQRTDYSGYSFTTEPADVAITEVGPSSVPSGGVRRLTITGRALHAKDVVQVTPAGGTVVAGTVITAASDELTVDVNLLGAPVGPATLTIRPYGAQQPAVVRTAAFTVGAPPQLGATRAPAITGTLAVGNLLRTTAGLWSPTPTAYSYQWNANGVAIKGATGTSYTIPPSLAGKRLSVTVTAARAGYTSGRTTSLPTSAIAKGKAAASTARPKVTGTAKVGRTVTAFPGSWSMRVDLFRYEWQLNGVRIRGAAGKTLKLTSSMAGKRVTVTVFAVKAGYNDGRATSYTVPVRR